MPATKVQLKQTREEWLRAMSKELEADFVATGTPLPAKLRISVGWPCKKALSTRGRRIGECFSPSVSLDDHTEIFISPWVGNALQAAGVLVHELCHAAVGVKHAHRKPFIDLSRLMGLEGKPTATTLGKRLVKRLKDIIDSIGPFPHATLDVTKLSQMKQTTRLLKVSCGECGYVVRTTQKWIDTGVPTCPCGCQMEVA